MISYNNRKILLGLILLLTLFSISIFLILKSSPRYNKLVISNEKYHSILNSRENSNSIILNSLEFNDYELIIDNDNNKIYYSLVNSSKMLNPSVKYKSNDKVNIAFSNKMNEEELIDNKSLKVIIYNENDYREYSLIGTKYPTLNVIYKNKDDIGRKVPVKLELFDNYVDSSSRFITSDGKFDIIETDKIYSFSLFKYSPGKNVRDNTISIFGLEKQDEYIIKKENELKEKEKYIELFINNEYKGLYLLEEKGGVNHFERNRQNNG